MKKNIRLIIICAVVLLILGGVLAFLLLTAPEEEEEEASSGNEVTTRLIYDKNPNDISKLTIENEHGSYEIRREGDSDNASWTIEGISGLPVNAASFNSIIESAATLTAQQTVVEEAEDISIYGLAEPYAKVTSVFTDSAGTVNTLIIGNEVPNSTNRYFMLEGDPAVYTVSASDVRSFFNDKYYVINRTVYNARTAADENDTTNYTRINKMTISRADLDRDVVIEYDIRLEDESIMSVNSSSYVMTEPVFRDLNPETSADVMNGIFGLTASDLGILHPNDEDMEQCGINSPAAEVTAEINGGDVLHFSIGNEYRDQEGNKQGRFVYVEGIDIIYIFEENSLPWLDFAPLRIVTSMITSNYIYDIESLDITGENVDAHFALTEIGDNKFAVKLDGSDTDDELFKDLYQFILRVPGEEFCFEETDAEPALTIEIKTYKGGGDVIEFIPSDVRKMIVRLNGRSVYKCPSAYVDRLVQNIELYRNGQEPVENW